MIGDPRRGHLDSGAPAHGTLIFVRRNGRLRASRHDVAEQRIDAKTARDTRIAEEK